MTPTLARLAALGLTVERFCELTHLHPVTVRHWGRVRTSGGGRRLQREPAWVGLLLSAWEALGGIHDW